MGRRALEGALRVPLGGPVQPLARPRDRARVPRRDAAGRGGEARPLLLHVRAALLLDEDHAGRARVRREARDRGGDRGARPGAQRESRAVQERRRRDLPPLLNLRKRALAGAYCVASGVVSASATAADRFSTPSLW